MRIATWNLDHASNSSRPIPAQIDKICTIGADIWVLTETADEVNLGGHGYQCATPPLKNSYKKYWSTIWSKWPIVEQINCNDGETAVCTIIDTPSGKMIVYGTIITWKNDKGPEKSSPAWFEHDKSIVVHGDDWKMIQDQHPGVPLIVAGDFNQTRDGASRGYRSPNGINLLNDQLRRNRLICISDDDFGKQGKLMPDPNNRDLYRHNVDHICVSTSRFAISQVGVWDHFSGETYWSDHNGVYADLELL